MIDFYEKLNLETSMSLEEIRKKLLLEHKKANNLMVHNSEKAIEKMNIINQAYIVFETEATRNKYDKELYDFKNAKPVDPNAERKKEFKKWYKQAKEYYDEETYDLAYTSINNAMSFISDENKTVDYYLLVARIYCVNEHFDSAVESINNAIVLDKNNIGLCFEKALIYDEMANGDYTDTYDAYKLAEKFLKQVIKMSTEKFDTKYISKAYDILAYYYYYEPYPNDKSIGISYANQALNYDPEAFNSKKIIAEEKRIKEEKIAREENERIRAEQERIRKEQARIESERRAAIEAAEYKKSERKRKANKFGVGTVQTILTILGWLCLGLPFLGVACDNEMMILVFALLGPALFFITNSRLVDDAPLLLFLPIFFCVIINLFMSIAGNMFLMFTGIEIVVAIVSYFLAGLYNDMFDNLYDKYSKKK